MIVGDAGGREKGEEERKQSFQVHEVYDGMR
jgi:hypothetical protein